MASRVICDDPIREQAHGGSVEFGVCAGDGFESLCDHFGHVGTA